ncbi:MAG TPA: M14 family metallocarboxypeptidase [Candidatus Acidoferrum sp.]|nr:M14 family metallocarboxypeptidase [Candidatus Acidoferrum sp.]
MERLGKNHSGYHGETIDIHAVLRDLEAAARAHGWSVEVFGRQGEFNLLALHHPPLTIRHPPPAIRIYLSAGIHGDEPAGPLAALRLLQENPWPVNAELWCCPCLNPLGFVLNRRENADGQDLNRDYRHLQTAEVRAHIAWLERQPRFDLCLCLHEDWESHGFYVYELNPENRPSLAEEMVAQIAKVCPIDPSPVIEGREARGGIIRPNLDPATRPQWAEAFYQIVNKTRQSYTLEAPSDFPLPTRVNALVTGVKIALATFTDFNRIEEENDFNCG